MEREVFLEEQFERKTHFTFWRYVHSEQLPELEAKHTTRGEVDKLLGSSTYKGVTLQSAASF